MRRTDWIVLTMSKDRNAVILLKDAEISRFFLVEGRIFEFKESGKAKPPRKPKKDGGR